VYPPYDLLHKSIPVVQSIIAAFSLNLECQRAKMLKIPMQSFFSFVNGLVQDQKMIEDFLNLFFLLHCIKGINNEPKNPFNLNFPGSVYFL